MRADRQSRRGEHSDAIDERDVAAAGDGVRAVAERHRADGAGRRRHGGGELTDDPPVVAKGEATSVVVVASGVTVCVVSTTSLPSPPA